MSLKSSLDAVLRLVCLITQTQLLKHTQQRLRTLTVNQVQNASSWWFGLL